MVTSISHPVRFLVWVGYFLAGFSVSSQAQIPAPSKNNFAKADSVAALYPHYSLADVKGLADKLTQPFTSDTDKFRAIYRWVCNNIENDYGLYVRNKSRREKLKDRPEELRQWNQKINRQFFHNLLHEHKTVCTGYAYLLKELCFHAGLTCKIIDGYGRTTEANVGGAGIANHSWNAVQLNHQWYLCDATWSSGAIDPAQKRFIKQYNDAYFLTPPSLFGLNHYPLDTAWLLVADKPTLPEFLNGPLVYKDLLNYGVLPIFPKAFHVEAAQGEKITFRFRKEGNLQIEKAELRIVRGITSTAVFPNLNEDSNGLITIDYVFTSKGKYVIHLLFNDDYVITYTVSVSKLAPHQ